MQRFTIKRGFTDGKLRQLIFSNDEFSFENGDHAGNEFTTFKKDEIAEFRFGIRWIRFRFTIGREYRIFVRSKSEKTIKITFKSYFRRNLTALHEQYSEILVALSDHYFDSIHDDFVKKINSGEKVKIGEVDIDLENVSFAVSGFVSEKRIQLSWPNIGLKLYHRYFSIYDVTDAISRNRGYNFHEDWNAALLYDVLKTISDQKRTNSEQDL